LSKAIIVFLLKQNHTTLLFLLKLAVVFACSAPLWFCLSKTMQLFLLKQVFLLKQKQSQQLKLRFSSCMLSSALHVFA
jgi:hypothetical protein